MPKDIFNTKLLGMNLTAHPREIADNELSDMTNLEVTRLGELVRRKGIRFLNSAGIKNIDTNGDQIFREGSKIRYKQVFTGTKEYLDVFTVGNKLYFYDEVANRFNLMYHAPGESELDLETYLGHILVSSHDSNLAVFKRHAHNAYLLDKGTIVIKAEGNVIDSNTIDFQTQDSFEDGDLEDFDIDQTNLYTASRNEGSLLRPLDVTAINSGGTAVETSDVTILDDHKYGGDITLKIGYDISNEMELKQLNDPSDLKLKFHHGDKAVQKVTLSSGGLQDLKDGGGPNGGGEDGYREVNIKNGILERTYISRLPPSGKSGLSSGNIISTDPSLEFSKGTVSWIDKFRTNIDSGDPTQNDLEYKVTEYGTGIISLQNIKNHSADISRSINALARNGQSWEGKTIYIGHGCVTNMRLHNPSNHWDGLGPNPHSKGYFGYGVSQNDTWRHLKRYGHSSYGTWVYWKTGSKASDFFNATNSGQQETSTNIEIPSDYHIDSFSKTALQNMHEFVGVFIASPNSVGINNYPSSDGGPKFEVGNIVNHTGRFEQNHLAQVIYESKAQLCPAQWMGELGSDYSREQFKSMRSFWINESISGIGVPQWEKMAIGKVVGGNIVYYDEATDTTIRDTSGYKLNDLIGRGLGVKLEKQFFFNFDDKTGGTKDSPNRQDSESTDFTAPSITGGWTKSDNDYLLQYTFLHGTLLEARLETENILPDIYSGYENWIDFAGNISVGRLQHEMFKRYEFDEDGKALSTTLDDGPNEIESKQKSESTLGFSPYNVWWRIESIFTVNSEKKPINAGFPYLTQVGAITNDLKLLNEDLESVLRINFSFDMDYNNANGTVIDDDIGTDISVIPTEDYLFEFPADRSDFLKIRQHNKDNLGIADVIDIFRSDTIAKVYLAKGNYFYSYIEDKFGSYLVAFTQDYNGLRALTAKSLPTAIYGADKKMLKSFAHNTGKTYAVLLTNLGLYIMYLYKDGNGVDQNIMTIETLDANTNVSAPIVIDDIIDITFKSDDGGTDLFLLFRDATNPIVKLRIIDSGVGSTTEDLIDFQKNGDGKVAIYKDLTKNELEYYATGSTAPLELDNIAFTFDDGGDPRFAIEKTSGATNVINGYEWIVDTGLNAGNYDDILTDNNFGHVKQVTPFNTPIKPIVSAVIAVGSLSGKYVYMYVVREYDSNDEILYESYSSNYSKNIVVSGSNNVVQIEQFPDNGYYIPSIPDADHYKILMYRADVTSIIVNGENETKYVRLTDFYNIKIDFGNGSGPQTENPLKESTTPGAYIMDSVIFPAPLEDTIGSYDDLDKYRGYSNFYPRPKLIATYNNVIYTANDFKFKNNLYFSELFDPTQWNPSKLLGVGAFTNDEITSMVINDGLYVFTRDQVDLVTGIGTNIVKTLLTNEIGCIEDKTIALVDGRIIFVSEKGIYSIRGFKYGPIDIKVAKITQEFTQNTPLYAFYDNYSQQYRIVYDNNKVLCYLAPAQLWFKFEYESYSKILAGFTRENSDTDITENFFILLNKELDSDNKETNIFRIGVEDKYVPYDQSSGDTYNKIVSTLYTKHYDFSNPYNDIIARRIYLDCINSHIIDGKISINEGEFTDMVQQTKPRINGDAYFNEVPRIWYRFNELFGSKLVNYGTSGKYAIQKNCRRNVDGKIDRTYQAIPKLKSESIIRDFPTLKNATISAWVKPLANTRTVLLSNSSYALDPNFLSTIIPYTEADFTPWLSDSNATIDTQFIGDKIIEDSLGEMRINIDTNYWKTIETIGAGKNFIGENIGINTRGGEVALEVATGETWTTFADGVDGMKTYTLPQIGIGKMIIEDNNKIL